MPIAIAGQGGFDPKGMTPVNDYVTTGSTTYVTLKSIAGSGVLTSFLAQHNATGAYIKITIDGVALTEMYSHTQNYVGNMSLSELFRFESSLLIQGKIDGSGNLWFMDSILLD